MKIIENKFCKALRNIVFNKEMTFRGKKIICSCYRNFMLAYFSIYRYRFTIYTSLYNNTERREIAVKWFIDRVANPLTIIVASVYIPSDDNVGTDFADQCARLTADFLHMCFWKMNTDFTQVEWKIFECMSKGNETREECSALAQCLSILITRNQLCVFIHNSRLWKIISLNKYNK